MKRQVLLLPVLCICLGLPAAICAQEYKASIQIADASAPGSPLRVSGQVFFEERNSPDNLMARYSLDASVLNDSSKPILSYDVVMQLAPEYAPGTRAEYRDDRFFGDPLQPGSQYLIKENPSPWEFTLNKGNATLTTARVQAKIVFVQFADGSKFGSSIWASHLGADRGAAIDILNRLSQAYDAGGPEPLAQAMLAALNDASKSFGSDMSLVVHQVNRILSSQGSGAAVAEIHKFLDNANRRKDILQ